MCQPSPVYRKYKSKYKVKRNQMNDFNPSTIVGVSMGLTVSRKTAKNLAVRRYNERILTVSRKKM